MAEEYISSYLAEKLKLYGYPVKYEIQGKFGLTEVKKVIKRIIILFNGNFGYKLIQTVIVFIESE